MLHQSNWTGAAGTQSKSCAAIPPRSLALDFIRFHGPTKTPEILHQNAITERHLRVLKKKTAATHRTLRLQTSTSPSWPLPAGEEEGGGAALFGNWCPFPLSLSTQDLCTSSLRVKFLSKTQTPPHRMMTNYPSPHNRVTEMLMCSWCRVENSEFWMCLPDS